MNKKVAHSQKRKIILKTFAIYKKKDKLLFFSSKWLVEKRKLDNQPFQNQKHRETEHKKDIAQPENPTFCSPRKSIKAV